MTYRVELFCEDNAHERCARALVQRASRELAVEVSLHVAAARFGIPRLKQELGAFQAVVSRRGGAPDLLVVLVDANDVGPAKRREEVEQVIDEAVFPCCVIGTPDPCAERWLLTDPVSFAECFGQQPRLGAPRRRHEWKRWLVESLERAGQIVMQGGAEFADEIIEAMDYYRAGKADPTIQSFVDDLRAALKRLKDQGLAGR